MTPMKKVEIVTDLLELPTISRALEELGVSGYTILRDVTGYGGRGRRTGRSSSKLTGDPYLLDLSGAALHVGNPSVFP